MILIFAIFAINVFLHRPVLESFIFSLALAVGLTPQLLPAIISINLAQGAKRMAAKKVIVKQLSSIENFGSMNVLCSDKTGTITEGIVKVHSAVGIDGAPSEKTLLYAYLNACFEKGYTNPIDEALRAACELDKSKYRPLDEIPYDFTRKRLSVLISTARVEHPDHQGRAGESPGDLRQRRDARRQGGADRRGVGAHREAVPGPEQQGAPDAGRRLQGRRQEGDDQPGTRKRP